MTTFHFLNKKRAARESERTTGNMFLLFKLPLELSLYIFSFLASCPRDPVKILGIYFSYDDKMNDHYNFNVKTQKLQTHLDIWSSRSLTLFGKVLIIKSLGLSQILYSASNTNVPNDAIKTVKRRLLLNQQIKNFYLGFFPILPVKKFWKK